MTHLVTSWGAPLRAASLGVALALVLSSLKRSLQAAAGAAEAVEAVEEPGAAQVVDNSPT
jgi:hypothetical protein